MIDRLWLEGYVLEKLAKARPLDRLMIKDVLSEEDYKEEILVLLDELQNEDGGFPGYMEADVRSSRSTIIATNTVLKYYIHCGGIKGKYKKRVEDYLDRTFNASDKQWNILSADISDAPRAIWWNDESKFGYVNPTASLLGCIKKLLLDVKAPVDELVNDILNLDLSDIDEHDYESLMDMYEFLEIPLSSKMLDALKRLMVTDRDKWHEYVAGPSRLINSKSHPLYSTCKKDVDDHIALWLNVLKEEGCLNPTWQWYQYEDDFKDAVYDWQGVLTYNFIKTMDRFGLLK